MSLEGRFRAGLLTYPALAALLGSRLYLMQIPDNPTYPAAAYQRISTVETLRHADPGEDPEDPADGWARFQVTIASASKTGGADCLRVAAAVRAAIRTFNLAAGAVSPAVLRAAPNFVVNQRMEMDPLPNQPIFRVVMDLKIWSLDLS